MPLLYTLLIDPAYQRLRYRTAFVLFAAIVAMGAIPGARSEIGAFASGVVLHSLAYGTLAFLIFTGSEGNGGSRALRSVLTVAAMGAVDELVQSMLPYRVGALADWLVDCGAALVVAGALWAILPRLQAHGKPRPARA